MKMIIQTPDFKAQKTLTDFINDNVGKLAQLSDRIIESRVCLKLDKSDTKENKICELKVVIPGNDLFAEKKSFTFEDAAMKAIDAIRHQLERWKGDR